MLCRVIIKRVICSFFVYILCRVLQKLESLAKLQLIFRVMLMLLRYPWCLLLSEIQNLKLCCIVFEEIEIAKLNSLDRSLRSQLSNGSCRCPPCISGEVTISEENVLRTSREKPTF